MTDTLEIAKRVEALDGPDLTVAKDIMRALFPDKIPSVIVGNGYGWREDCSGWWLATGEDTRTPPKTIYPPNWLGSLDAAMTLGDDDWQRADALCTAMQSLGNPDYMKGGAWLRLLPIRTVAAILRAKEASNGQ